MAGKFSKLYRRMVYGEPIVVVSGLPRSGTSMTMKMLEAGGVRVVTDGARTADVDNPKGYCEGDRVLDLAKEVDTAWLPEARGQAVKIISYLLRHLPEDNNYKVLFMRREISEVLASQTKMLARRARSRVPMTLPCASSSRPTSGRRTTTSSARPTSRPSTCRIAPSSRTQ